MTAFAGIEVALGVAAHESVSGIISFVLALLAIVSVATWLATRMRPPNGWVERWVLGTGVGVALLAPVGVALHFTPWGLPRRPPVVGPSGPILTAPLLDATGRWLILAVAAFAVAALMGVAFVPLRFAARPGLRVGGLWGLAAVTLAAAWAVALSGALEDRSPGFTQLSALRPDETTVVVAIRNQEGAATAYTLELVVDGRVARRWEGIHLEQGTSWETALDIRAERERAGIVEARLYRDSAPDVVYRRAISRP